MTVTARARPTATGLALAVPITLGACASASPEAPSPTGNPTTGDRTDSPEAAPAGEETIMRIGIRIGDQQFTATLDHSAASVDLLAQLPVTIEMIDHGGVEKTGPLPGPLSLEGQPEGADPEIGDLGYYAPGNDLVLYYGDQSYFPGIVVLGRLDDIAAERIAALDGAVTATLEAR
ncbi:hypothetical protein ACVW2K_002167 [Nocardioides sp. HB32]